MGGASMVKEGARFIGGRTVVREWELELGSWV